MPTVVEFTTLARQRPATAAKPNGTDEVYLSAVVREDSGQYVHVTRWGRRLSKGQGDRLLCGGLGDAGRRHSRKVSEKLLDGYDEVDGSAQYFGMGTWVQALGEREQTRGNATSEQVASRAEPALQQRERIWELARQGMVGWKISDTLNVPQDEVAAELKRFRAAENQRLRDDRARQARNVAPRAPAPPPATPKDDTERQVRDWLDV